MRRALFACPACWKRLPYQLQKPITENYMVRPGSHQLAMAAACDWYRANPDTAAAPTPTSAPGEERCERTELLVSQCACPQHRGGADPNEQLSQERAALLAKPGWVAARFASVCGCCGEDFPKGAAIHAISTGGWRAECCAEAS